MNTPSARPDKIIFRRIRLVFWLVGILLGALLSYTTRHFVNSDALAYAEMGEIFIHGNMWGLVNFTFSSIFAVLTGLLQLVPWTTPVNEILVLKIASFATYAMALGSCDLLMNAIRDQWNDESTSRFPRLPFSLASALCYMMFLVATLVWVRVRLINPDMLIMVFALLSVACVLRIREQPFLYSRYVMLGMLCGLGYLSKAVFFAYSPFLFILTVFVSPHYKKSFTRIVCAVAVYLIVISPLVGALSYRKGGFSYGEAGEQIYARDVAGKGSPVNLPETLYDDPKVVKYSFDLPCTVPHTYDVYYWHIGISPDYHIADHVKHTLRNTWLVLEQSLWLFGILVWVAFHAIVGTIRLGSFRPLSTTLVLLTSGLAGVGLFALIAMEPRYVAPFSFLVFAGLVTAVRVPANDYKAYRRASIGAIAVLILLFGVLAQSSVDQTVRSLYSSGSKPSYKAAYFDQIAVRDFLKSAGVKPGDQVAVVGFLTLYWGRMAGVKVVGHIEDLERFVKASPKNRAAAIEALRKAGFKAIIGKGLLPLELANEGWRRIPKANSYYGIIL